MKTYVKHKECGILFQLLQPKYMIPKLESQLEESWLRDYKDNKFFLIDGLLYNRERHTSALTIVDRDHISLILQECHDCPYMGCMSEVRTKERVASTAWSPKWEQELSEYINTSERCQEAIRKHGKEYGLLQHMEEPKHPWETIDMDWVTGLVPGGKENFNSCLITVDRFRNSVRCLPCHKKATAMDTALLFGITTYPSLESLELSLVIGIQNSHQSFVPTCVACLVLSLRYPKITTHRQMV
ncbi:hypothetical protein O181_034466 [Austropuccinia psidii MF-1]|uniref:Integrase zinc-binding domain-containing protein n=1 Tax=Austropuccinia psidii MF-1 TaxID=1389203 RepID=A0A9Q3D6F1_9BASI|nr:hypothetical protein [Austropuccinia psidii MF-1]